MDLRGSLRWVVGIFVGEKCRFLYSTMMRVGSLLMLVSRQVRKYRGWDLEYIIRRVGLPVHSDSRCIGSSEGDSMFESSLAISLYCG